MSNREKINLEVVEDLNKTYEQLLTDIHEELLNSKRSQVENITHALKRASSFFTKRELENAKVQRRMNWFTIIVGLFTILNVIIYILRLCTKS